MRHTRLDNHPPPFRIYHVPSLSKHKMTDSPAGRHAHRSQCSPHLSSPKRADQRGARVGLSTLALNK